MVNLKLVTLGSVGVLSVAGATTFYFLVPDNKEQAPAPKPVSFFKTKFPNMTVLPESKSSLDQQNKTLWLPKIEKLKAKYKVPNSEVKAKLLESMYKVLPKKVDAIDKYINVSEFTVDLDLSAFLLSQYCNAVWNSSEEHLDVEEIVKDLCVKEE